MGGWPWPLDAVQGFFTSSFSAVWSWVDTLKNNVWGFITWLKDEVWNKIVWAKDAIWNFFTWLKDRLWEKVEWLKDQVWGFFDWLRTQIVAILSGLAAAAGTIAKGIWDQLGPALTLVKDTVWNYLKNLWDTWIWPGLQWLAKEFKTRILDPVWNFLMDLWNKYIQPGLHWLWFDVIEPGLNKITGGLYGLLKWLLTEIMGYFNPKLGEVTKQVTETKTAFDGAFAGLPDILKGPLESMGKFFEGLSVEKLQAAIGDLGAQMNTWAASWQAAVGVAAVGGSPITPEEAASRVPAIIGSGLAAEIGVDVLGIAIEALGLGQLETPYWALGSLLRTIGIEGTVAKTIAMRVERGIWVPYSRFLNKELRPEVLALPRIDQAYWQDNVGLQAWRDAYAYSGIPEPIIDAWYKSMWEPPRPYDLVRAGEVGIQDEEWADRALKARGMSPVDREKMLEMIDRRSVMSIDNMIRSEAIRDYAEGNIEMPALDTILRDTHATDRQIEKLTKYAESLADDYYRKEWIEVHLTEFRKGQADEKTLTENLLRLIKNPDRVKRKVALELAKKFKLQAADAASQQRIAYASVVVARYKEGFIDRARMDQELALLQQITDPMQLATFVAELSYDTDYKTDLSKFYTEMYAKAVWPIEEYKAAMKTVIVVPERLEAKIAYETARILKKPKAEIPAEA